MEANQLVYKTNCPTCFSNKYKVIFANIKDQDDYGNLLEKPFKDLKFVVVRCNSCSTTYLQVRPNDKCIGRYYEGEYHCYKSFSSRGFLMNIFSKVSGKLIANSLRKKINKSSTDKHYLLDYGCGSGNWINILKNEFKNWKFAGTEVTTQAVDLARLNDIDCYKSDENDLLEFFEENSVDVVNLFHVIEHIPDPLKALKVLKKILVPGGIIIGQTPNIDSWDAKLFGKNWSQLHIPRHMTLYSPKTLRIHAIKSGMNLIEI